MIPTGLGFEINENFFWPLLFCSFLNIESLAGPLKPEWKLWLRRIEIQNVPEEGKSIKMPIAGQYIIDTPGTTTKCRFDALDGKDDIRNVFCGDIRISLSCNKAFNLSDQVRLHLLTNTNVFYDIKITCTDPMEHQLQKKK